ncbi:hypothetical protein GJAV_G00163970 [Gymnothorax javanicus]|nr:hypothetical protein GJAV_G00163970 [Gymnothorax javanicus]
MKGIIFIVFAAAILHVSTYSKLAVITGLNGGLLTGLNPRLAVAGLNPGLIVAGVNPGLPVAAINPVLPGGGLIAQPQFAQVFPGVPAYLPPTVPYVPRLGYPQMQQFPRQPVFPANGGYMPQNNLGVQQGMIPGQQQGMGRPYYMGMQPQNPFGPQPGMNPLQQQVMGTTGRPWNVNQQPGPVEAGPVRRYRRMIPLRPPPVKACGQAENVHQNPQQAVPTPTPTDLAPVPKLLKMDN